MDESIATSHNIEVGHHREPPGGRGTDDPPATTKHDRAAEDTGSAAVRVTPHASRTPSHHPATVVLAKIARRDAPQNHCPEAAALEPNTLTPDQPRYWPVINAVDPAPPLLV
jgi:hypothetical protein